MFKDYPPTFTEIDKSIFLIILIFPIFFITGNLLINFFYISIAILSIFNFSKNSHFLRSTIFYLLIFFLLYLIVNLLLSTNTFNSLPRVLKFLLIILFVKEIHSLNNKGKNYFEKIIKFWSLVYFIVTIDILFEVFFGFNTLGFRSTMEGRIASFFGDELVVGTFYHFFSLIFLAYLVNQKYSNFLIILLIIMIVITSFMIGERANFIKLFLSILIFSLIIFKTNYIKKISILIIILSILATILYSNEGLQKRYYNQISTIYSVDGIEKYFKESQYGAHQITAYEIFKDNLFFGVGLKNFREESRKAIYENKDYKKTYERQATHPHQVHLELLSEIGLIGYISFFILMLFSVVISAKNYLKNQNLYQLSTIIYIISCLIPLIPSGSLFSTFFGGIFWLSFGLMVSFNRSLKLKV